MFFFYNETCSCMRQSHRRKYKICIAANLFESLNFVKIYSSLIKVDDFVGSLAVLILME
jgi:hypothetical protein